MRLVNHSLYWVLAPIAGIGITVVFVLAGPIALAQASSYHLQVTSTPKPTPLPPEMVPPPAVSFQAFSTQGCDGIRCEFRVGSSTDDAGLLVPFPAAGSCYYSTSHNEVWFGECPDGEIIVSGFRFPNVTIPRGTRIAQAYLEFTVDGPYDNNVLLDIYGEAMSNAVPLGPFPNRPSDRVLTTAFVPWSIPSADRWQISQTRRSPDLTPIIQEITSQDSWQDGNALAIIFNSIALGALSDPDPAFRHRRVVGFDRPSTTYIGDVPRLVIILPCEDVEVSPPLSGIGQAVSAAVGSQQFCENSYQGLSFTPGDPLSENTGFHDWATLAETAEQEVLFTNMAYDVHLDGKGTSPGDILAAAIGNLYSRIHRFPHLYPQGLTVRILVGNQPYGGAQRLFALDDLRRHGVLEMENRSIGWKVEVARYRHGPDTDTWSHAKFMVVDGQTALAAGFNMKYEHLKDFVDFGVRLTGPVAHHALDAFDELWRGAEGLDCDLGPANWRSTCVQYTVSDRHVADVEAIRTTGGDTNSFSFFRTDRSDLKEADIAVWAALAYASDSIDALNPWFTADEPVPDVDGYDFELKAPLYMKGIREALEKNGSPESPTYNPNFRVRLLLAPEWYFRQLNEWGIEIFLSEIGDLDRFVEIREFSGRSHAKVSLIDGSFLIVGSQNWSFSAFGDDDRDSDLAEYSLGVDSVPAAQEFLLQYYEGGYDYWGNARRRTDVAQGEDLKAIIEAASDGDVIVIHGDRYELIGPINVTSEIRIIGMGTVLTPAPAAAAGSTTRGSGLADPVPISSDALLTILASNVEVMGLNLQAAEGSAIVIGAPELDLENIWIRQVVFEGNDEAGVFVAGEQVSFIVENNTFINGDFGVEISLSEAQEAPSYVGGNIFAGQFETPVLAIPGDGGDVEYAYNLFFDCSFNTCVEGWFEGNIGINSNVHDNLFDLDPLFANFDAGDYRLVAGSPAIDAADPRIVDIHIPDGDGDGISRLDIGAFEAFPSANNPPVAEAGGPYSANEGSLVIFDGSASFDPDGDPLEYRWDFNGDGVFDSGYSSQPLAEFTFGDDFRGEGVLEVRDTGGLIVPDTAAIEVLNVDPSITLDISSAIAVPAGRAFLGRMNAEQLHDASATDIGSDDLTFTWGFGVVRTYFNNGVGPDPFQSPDGIFPYAVADSGAVTFLVPGIVTISVDVADDDGGSASISLPKLVTGDAVCSKSLEFWEDEYEEDEEGVFDDADLVAFLDIVRFASTYFSEKVPLSSIQEAHQPLDGDDSTREEATAEALAAWLNLAQGAVGWDDLIDTDDDGIGDTPFHEVMAEIESILRDDGATDDMLEHAEALAASVNELSAGNPLLCADVDDDDEDDDDDD